MYKKGLNMQMFFANIKSFGFNPRKNNFLFLDSGNLQPFVFGLCSFVFVPVKSIHSI